MKSKIDDILKRRGALHVIDGHRFYTEQSMFDAINEALNRHNISSKPPTDAIDFADFCLKHEIVKGLDNIKRWAFYAGDGTYVLSSEKLYELFKNKKQPIKKESVRRTILGCLNAAKKGNMAFGNIQNTENLEYALAQGKIDGINMAIDVIKKHLDH